MVLEDGGLVVAQRVGNALAFVEFHHHAAEVVVQRVVVVEGADILGQRIELAAQRGPRAAMGAVRVRRRHGVRPGLVHARVDGKRRRVDRVVALHHVAVVIAADQVGHRHLAEMDAERVDPEGVLELGVARGDMTGHAFIEPEFREQPERRRQPLLAVQPLLRRGVELGRARQVAVAGLDLLGQALGHVVGAGCGLRGVHGVSPSI
ncbi:hypothetical protein D3C81_1276720 [compost metagenome]